LPPDLAASHLALSGHPAPVIHFFAQSPVDQTTLKLIARLKHDAHKQGVPIDVVRFAADRNYARWALTQFTATASEEGIVLALQIMNRLRLAAPVPQAHANRLRTAKAPLDAAVPAPVLSSSL
jgi:hypothetical protein